MELKETKRAKTQYMTMLAMMIAVVAVCQYFLGMVHIGPATITFALLPIVVGAVLLGPGAGAILGFVFGAVVLYQGVTGQDVLTNFMINTSPVYTVLVCLVKGAAAGAAAGWVYKLLEKKNRTVAAIAAAITAPIVNTAIFVLWGLLVVNDEMSMFMQQNGFEGQTVVYFIFIVLAGINFIVEFSTNIILSPVIVRVLQAVRQQGGSRSLDA